jgi:serine/threonine-protein kinase
MAEVYLAHDEVLDRDVALKVLRDKYAKNEELVKRFRREARSAASLNHPNIVPVYDQGCSEDDTYYIAMEYVPGGTLKDRILGNGLLDPSAVTELGFQVARALGHAHEHGVIHLDIKSQNILLTEAGYAKVADFGIARAATATTTASRSSLILGTPGYISPEQAMGKAVDPRSDLYSLGVVLYEMLTGTLPYSGESPVSMALKHVDEPPRSPREANPNIPEPLNALTAKLLAKDPEERYASAIELANDLERVGSALSPLVVNAEKTTTKMAAAPLLSTTEKLPKRTAIQPHTASPMEVFKSGRRRKGRLFRALATLLFSVILLSSLAWLLMQDYSASATSGSEDTPSGDVATLPTTQVPDNTSETSGSEGSSSSEEAAPSTVQGEVPTLDYASEAKDTLTNAALKLGNRNEGSGATAPAGAASEQAPAAGTTVEEGTAKQSPTATQAAPASVGAVSQQAPATQLSSTAPAQKQTPATQAVLTRVDAGSQQATTPQTASTTIQTASASSSANDKSVQKEKKKGKK